MRVSALDEYTMTTEQTDDTSTNAGVGRRALYRRRFVSLTGGLGAALVAGCAGSPDSLGDTDGGDGGAESPAETGRFRLLISDQPNAIDQFESLTVSLDQARIFPAEEDDDERDDADDADADDLPDSDNETAENGPGNETELDDAGNETELDDEGNETTETDPANATETDDADPEDSDEDDDDDEQAGFSVMDLDGAEVDLTEVVGDVAVEVFDGDLEAGRYAKLELHVDEATGVVDEEDVDVKVPSEKLQIVRPFEVQADSEVSFVFDIKVIEKGGTGGYNLLPVIGKSGVVGEDVDVEEKGRDEGDDEADDETEDDDEESDDSDTTGENADADEADSDEDDGNGPPDDPGDGDDSSDQAGDGS